MNALPLPYLQGFVMNLRGVWQMLTAQLFLRLFWNPDTIRQEGVQ